MEMDFKPGSTASDAGDIKCDFESDPEYDEELRRINLEWRRRKNIGQTERGFGKVPLQTATMVSTDFVKTEPEDDYEAAPTPPVAVAPPVETMSFSYEVDIKPYVDGVKPEPQDENGGTAVNKPKGKKIQKRVAKTRPDRTTITKKHQNKLVQGDDQHDARGTGVPPTKKRRAAKKQQEKFQNALAAIANQNNITKEVENEANIALVSNKVENLIVTEKCACSFCGKRFEDKSALKEHLRIHSGEKPYVCNVCDKSFTVNSHLKTHLRMHSGEKPYGCNVCDKRFTQSSVLTKHLRIHSGEKPYVCNVCDKRFTRSGHLKNHLRMHSGE